MDDQNIGEALKQVAQFVEGRSFAIIEDFTDPITGEPLVLTRDPSGEVSNSLQRILEGYRPNPRFREGTATLTTLDSFISHVNRFGDDESAVFASDDMDSPSVTAVLDYHGADMLSIDEGESTYIKGEYRRCKHRSQFDFPVSDELKAWMGANGETMSMVEFAQFLENRVLEVSDIDKVPESAELFVEMMGGAKNIADWSTLTKLAKSLVIYESAYVSEITSLSSGALSLSINESQEAEVDGVKAVVPTMFFIEIPIFREGVKYRLPVRLRHRRGRGSISFFYELWGFEQAFKHAFDEAIQEIAENTPAQVFYGSPE